MTQREAEKGHAFLLSEDHRMLLQIRDTLYEGSWDDFLRDLQARAQGQPHVYDVVAASPAMKSTISHHLAMIEEMRDWETDHGSILHADSTARID